MATHFIVLAWRIPGMAEPGGLPSTGSHRVGHDWSDLAAAAAAPSVTQDSNEWTHYSTQQQGWTSQSMLIEGSQAPNCAGGTMPFRGGKKHQSLLGETRTTIIPGVGRRLKDGKKPLGGFWQVVMLGVLIWWCWWQEWFYFTEIY